jgi:hypothetical protein
MRWFRLNMRLGSRLALFALAVQMQLSLGHVHLPAAAMSSAALTVADESGAALAGTHDPIHNSNGSIDLYCPICALIQLLATAAPAEAPALRVPANLAEIGLQAPAKLAVASSLHFSFQARAPPSI